MNQNDNEIRRMTNESRLAQWQKMQEHALHSDRLAGEIGVFVLKIILVINGGALIAVMAAYAQLGTSKEIATGLADGGRLFLWGILVAALASAASYFYQSFVTAKLWNDMQEAFGDKAQYPWARRASQILFLALVFPLTLVAYSLFAYGAYKTLHTMELLANLPK